MYNDFFFICVDENGMCVVVVFLLGKGLHGSNLLVEQCLGAAPDCALLPVLEIDDGGQQIS